MCREHNNANVLTLGARTIQPEQALAMVDKWLKTPFAGGRHERRVEKISEIERAESKLPAVKRA
jgi:ribose 5-phosphate isomerase B